VDAIGAKESQSASGIQTPPSPPPAPRTVQHQCKPLLAYISNIFVRQGCCVTLKSAARDHEMTIERLPKLPGRVTACRGCAL